jgi:hypothetical protein
MANNFVLTGLHETLAGLKAFDEASLKKFNKVINDSLRKLKIEARAEVPPSPPMSGWRTTPAKKPNKSTRGGAGWPAWSTGEIKAGIVTSRAQGKVRRVDYTTSAGALINKSASGAIFDIANRIKSEATTSQGKNFREVLDHRFGGASRIVYRVVDKHRVQIEIKFKQALDEAKLDLQKALQSQQTKE